MPLWLLVVGCAVLAAALGATAPAVIGRLPEPTPEPSSEPTPEPSAGSSTEPGGTGAAVDPVDAGSATYAGGAGSASGEGGNGSIAGTTRDEGPGPRDSYQTLAGLPWLRPVVMGGSAVLAGVLAWRLGRDGEQLALLWWTPLVPLGLVLGIVDARRHLLPRRLIIPATLALVLTGSVAALLTGRTEDLVRALLGLAAAFALFFLLWFAWPSGLGYGDVRLSASLGFLLGWFGWAELVIGLYTGFVLMAVVGLAGALTVRGRGSLRRHHAFGPHLLAGAWLALFLTPWLATLIG